MADGKSTVTAADIGRFLVIMGLGLLATTTFLVAGTVVILMAVDSAASNAFRYFPVGIAVMGILGLFFLIDTIVEAIDAPTVFHKWLMSSKDNQDALRLAAISMIAILIILC